MRSSTSEAETPEADWGFLTRPKWMLSHLLVLVLVAAMVAAGLWQLQRHGERSDRNDLIRGRSELAPVDLAEVATPASPVDVGELEQYRQVSVTGTYVAEDQVLVRNRSFDGAPGLWVLTPIATDDGWAAIVNRGWVPSSFADEELVPPPGRVTIAGWIQPSRTAEGLQASDPATGRLESLARPDVERIARQVAYPVVPIVVQLRAERVGAEPPIPLPLPALDGGPHLSYAAQWFIFTTIALVGYPLILRRKALGRAEPLPAFD